MTDSIIPNPPPYLKDPDPAPRPDHALAAHRAAVAHLEACWAALNDEGDELAAVEFCGCIDCTVREALTAAEPHLRQLWLEEGR